MSSKVDIANAALVMIGADTVSALPPDSTSTEIKSVNALYEMVLANMLAKHRWRFCTYTVQLARLVAAPDDKWDAAYDQPADCIKVHAVRIGDNPIEYDRYGEKIYCNATEDDVVICEYTERPEEADMPEYFSMALAVELARWLAVPIGDRAELRTELIGEADTQLRVAKSLDSQQQTQRKLPLNKLINLRRT